MLEGRIIDFSQEIFQCVNFGVGSASPDMWYDKTYPCHKLCAERGITHMENLCNLDKLIGKRFTFIASGIWGRTKVERRQLRHEPKNKAVYWA